MTALETLAVCFLLTVGVAAESQSASVRDDATSSPALSMQQLLAMAERLTQDMAAMKAARKSDQSRLSYLEKRSNKFDFDLMVRYADIALLHHFMANINTTLRRVDNSTSHLQMQVAHMCSTQQRMQEEVRKLKDRAQLLEHRLAELSRVAEARSSEANVAGRGRNAMADFVSNSQDVQSRVAVLENVVNSRLDVHGAAEHEAKSTRGSRVGEPLRERDSGHSDHTKQRDVGHQLQVRSEADSQAFAEAGLGEDTSGDGDDFIDIDSSGDDDKKVPIIDETQVIELTSRRNDVHCDGDTPCGKDTKMTSAHITVNTVSTDIPTAVTDATQPDSPVHTLDSVSLLYQRLSDVEMRLNLTMPADEVKAVVAHETIRVNSELEKHIENLRQFESKMVELNTTVSWTASQTGSWRMMESMDGLQASLANFVNSVLTVEHWHAASVQLATASRRTDQRVSSLTSRVLDTTQLVHRLQTAVRDYQHLSERQFRVLQTHVIQLNNSVQDLLERIDKTARTNQGQLNDVHNTLNYGGEGQLLTSRLEDLALQLVYSDNRLSHLETTVLNASLARCQKANNDLNQDATLLRLNQAMEDVRNDVVVLRETVKRVDLGLHRLHGNGKVIQEDILGLQGQVKKTEGLPSVVQHLKQEVDNLLFQLPTDCDDCYDRGFHKTGDYIICPKNGLRSIKVRCIMDPWEEKDEEENNGLKDAAASKVKGGWTVVQQRHSGKVNFSRSWAEYEEGFGSSDTEYWMGNKVLHLMTSSGNYSLHIHMRDISGRYWHASYDVFSVSSKEDNYRLTLGRYRGNATDTLYYSSGMTFSTHDRDTDVSSLQCARYNGGGWWYRHCQISNLNGPFYAGMIWFHRDWHDWLQLREVVMLIRCARCAK